MPPRASGSTSPRGRPLSPTAPTPRPARSSPDSGCSRSRPAKRRSTGPASARSVPAPALEVRRVNELSDFDPALSGGMAAEWLAKEQEWRAANE